MIHCYFSLCGDIEDTDHVLPAIENLHKFGRMGGNMVIKTHLFKLSGTMIIQTCHYQDTLKLLHSKMATFFHLLPKDQFRLHRDISV